MLFKTCFTKANIMSFLKSLYPRKCILKLMKKNLSQVNIVTSVQLSDLGLMRQANPFLFLLHTRILYRMDT